LAEFRHGRAFGRNSVWIYEDYIRPVEG
jgi:hypothetical protein